MLRVRNQIALISTVVTALGAAFGAVYCISIGMTPELDGAFAALVIPQVGGAGLLLLCALGALLCAPALVWDGVVNPVPQRWPAAPGPRPATATARWFLGSQAAVFTGIALWYAEGLRPSLSDLLGWVAMAAVGVGTIAGCVTNDADAAAPPAVCARWKRGVCAGAAALLASVLLCLGCAFCWWGGVSRATPLGPGVAPSARAVALLGSIIVFNAVWLLEPAPDRDKGPSDAGRAASWLARPAVRRRIALTAGMIGGLAYTLGLVPWIPSRAVHLVGAAVEHGSLDVDAEGCRLLERHGYRPALGVPGECAFQDVTLDVAVGTLLVVRARDRGADGLVHRFTLPSQHRISRGWTTGSARTRRPSRA